MKMDYDEYDALDFLGGKFDFFRTGSRETCKPPVLNTDVDFVVLDPGFKFDPKGWELKQGDNNTYDQDDKFEVYVRGEVNLIVVHTTGFFYQWRVHDGGRKAAEHQG